MKKKDSLNQPNKTLNFWLCAGLLVVLLASIMARDITRPFCGLHSWAEAHGPWKARVHLRYGLGYTKGFMTNAVGNPPTENPTRYLDHPQLHSLLDAAAMAVLGINTWALRATNVLATVITLLLLLKILRRLIDDKTSLLAGLFFCLFPLIGYFGVNMWLYPLCFWAIWCYLVLIKALRNGPEPGAVHKWVLAAALFFSLQLSWEGFFFALAIGVHYVFRCIHRRQFPEKTLLAILIVAPLSSLALDFVILAAGHGWDFQRLIHLYKWRAGSGELKELTWPMWFGRFWEHAITNFTLPILITAIIYLTFGQLFIFMETKPNKQDKRRPRQFPQFWLFLMPALFQLFLLKGSLWRHQTWERPFVPFIAIAAAEGVMLLGDALRKINKIVAYTAMTVLVAVFAIFCVIGVKHYYYIRWQAPAKIEMLKMLNKRIPPDKALLCSDESFIVHQHKAKGEFYRPEIAWHLDREIFLILKPAAFQEKAKTGRYPFFLATPQAPVSRETRRLYEQALQPNLTPTERARREKLVQQARTKEVRQWPPFLNSLAKLYKYQQIPGEKGSKNRAGMRDYILFDLGSKGPRS